VGLTSNGLHSNGFSLVRKVFSKRELILNEKELLKPTRIYVKPILEALLRQHSKGEKMIKALAHITGGAFYNKIKRIIPADMDIVINKNSWSVPAIFRLIQNKANIQDRQMYMTFNMGIGMVAVVEPLSVNKILEIFNDYGDRPGS